MKKLNLPRKDKDGNQYISYSQATQWRSTYHDSYVLSYFFGIRDDSGPFAKYGSDVGEYLETSGQKVGEMLDASDKEILDALIVKLEPLEGKEYEKEIRLERELGYYIKGYIDLYYPKEGKANVIDFKTLNISKKQAFYENNDPDTNDAYMQTILYSRALEEAGEEIDYCGVIGLDRSFAGTFQEPILHLSGNIVKIETPYSKERADKFLLKLDKTVQEISESYNTFLTLQKVEI